MRNWKGRILQQKLDLSSLWFLQTTSYLILYSSNFLENIDLGQKSPSLNCNPQSCSWPYSCTICNFCPSNHRSKLGNQKSLYLKILYQISIFTTFLIIVARVWSVMGCDSSIAVKARASQVSLLVLPLVCDQQILQYLKH